jgi:hypothetical protein
MDQSGEYAVRFNVSDGSLSDANNTAITVMNVVLAPLFSTSSKTLELEENKVFNYHLPEATNSGKGLNYTLSGNPSWMSLEGKKVRGTPPYDAAGNYTITWTAQDSEGTGTFTLLVKVKDAARLPEFKNRMAKITVNENEAISYVLPEAESSISGEVLAYEVESKPDFVTINVATRALSGTPSYDDGYSTYQVLWKATGKEGIDVFTLDIMVKNVNRAPEISKIKNYKISEGEELSFKISVTDADKENKLITKLSNAPDGSSFINYEFKWAPAYTQSGKYVIAVSASDGEYSVDEEFSIIVVDAPAPIEDKNKKEEKVEVKDENQDLNSDVYNEPVVTITEQTTNTSEAKRKSTTWIIVEAAQTIIPVKPAAREIIQEALTEHVNLKQAMRHGERSVERQQRDERGLDIERNQYPAPDQYNQVRENEYDNNQSRNEQLSSSVQSIAARMNYIAQRNEAGELDSLEIMNMHGETVYRYMVKEDKLTQTVTLTRNDQSAVTLRIDRENNVLQIENIMLAPTSADNTFEAEVRDMVGFIWTDYTIN